MNLLKFHTFEAGQPGEGLGKNMILICNLSTNQNLRIN